MKSICQGWIGIEFFPPEYVLVSEFYIDPSPISPAQRSILDKFITG